MHVANEADTFPQTIFCLLTTFISTAPTWMEVTWKQWQDTPTPIHIIITLTHMDWIMIISK